MDKNQIDMNKNNQLIELEKHFNNIQHHYRLLSSTWMLSMLAGVGYVFVQTSLVLQKELFISIITFTGALGVTLLWSLDIKVYHQLLESCFVEGLKLERQNKNLPQIRSNMLKTQSNKGSIADSKGVLRTVVNFYIFAIAISISISLVSWVISSKLSLNFKYLITLSHLIILFVWFTIINYQTKSTLLEDYINSQKVNYT